MATVGAIAKANANIENCIVDSIHARKHRLFELLSSERDAVVAAAAAAYVFFLFQLKFNATRCLSVQCNSYILRNLLCTSRVHFRCIESSSRARIHS